MRLTFVLTVFTLVAFAANSVLCRIALGGGFIDPVSFTALRLISGAAILAPLAGLAKEVPEGTRDGGSWLSGAALFLYAIAFSLAYLFLDTGMGALILFGSVQVTMIGVGLKSGERPSPLQWLGLVAALGGLVYLVSPGITAPSPLGALLMTLSGMSWGIYSLRGRGIRTPIRSTSGNFVRTVPMAVVAVAFALPQLDTRTAGVVLALVSGAVTSGLGYVLWYRALRGLSTTQAAVVQLLVPILAALGGVMFLSEQVSTRLVLAAAMVLGGVLVAVVTRTSGQPATPAEPRTQ